MSRLVDIKELSFGITPVSDYVISRAKESAGEDFSLTLPSVETGYPPGSDITIRGINGFVTTREYNSGPKGYQTVIGGVSKVADVIRKAPPKTLMFMSMTESEKDDFEIANQNDSGAVDYSGMDYIPLIKICDDRTLEGGWASGEVIAYLAQKVGLEVVCNVRSYWLRQVQADVQSSYFDVIVSIVNFLKPTIFVDDGIIYILNKPLRSGLVSLDKIENFTQREIFNYDSRVSYLKVQGGLGAWNRAKEKGNVHPEKNATLTTESARATQQYMTINVKGTREVVNKDTGEKTTTDNVPMSFTVPMKNPRIDKVTRTETILLDPHGNRKALLSVHEVGTWVPIEGMGEEFTVLDSVTDNEYDYLSEEYDKPREKSSEQTISKWTWQIVDFPGYPVRKYKRKTDVIVNSRVYGKNGNLLVEYMTRETDVLVLQIGLGLYTDVTYIELNLADMMWPIASAIQRLIVEETETRYRQLTKDVYEKAVYRRTPAGLRRKQGDEVRLNTTQRIMGRVPKYPKSCRRSHIYAESIPSDEMTSMDVPAVIISNPNIISWDDAEAILGDLKKEVVDYEETVEREYVIPGDMDVDIGWPVEFGEVNIGKAAQIPSVSVTDGKIVSWQKTKEAESPSMITRIVVQGKVLSS